MSERKVIVFDRAKGGERFQCAWWRDNDLTVSSPHDDEVVPVGLWFLAFCHHPEDGSGAPVLLDRAALTRLHAMLGEWLAEDHPEPDVRPVNIWDEPDEEEEPDVIEDDGLIYG